MYNPSATARHYEERAREYQLQAERASHPTTREIYLRLVATFDTLADWAARLATALERKDDAPPPSSDEPAAPRPANALSRKARQKLVARHPPPAPQPRLPGDA